MVTSLDMNNAYYFAGIPAYITLSPVKGIMTCTVRMIGTQDLLAMSTDLESIRQRLLPWGQPAKAPQHHAW